jgi:hypothetical protein
VLADLRGFYAAFAYRPRTEDPPDHVAVEAGFAGYLALKIAYAARESDAIALETTEGALRRFQRAHLARIAGPLAERLSAGEPAHLRAAARILVRRAGAADASLPVLREEPEGPPCCPGDESLLTFDLEDRT